MLHWPLQAFRESVSGSRFAGSPKVALICCPWTKIQRLPAAISFKANREKTQKMGWSQNTGTPRNGRFPFGLPVKATQRGFPNKHDIICEGRGGSVLRFSFWSPSQMPSGHGKKRASFCCWLILRGNPYPKKGKKATPWQQRPSKATHKKRGSEPRYMEVGRRALTGRRDRTRQRPAWARERPPRGTRGASGFGQHCGWLRNPCNAPPKKP